ncbi:DUF2207 domain-containing protein [Candidatus Saccharibacteria bacterium]|nr:DUF2207 domain-containing protein [Candidatus Saccharibacteria bacterium]
MKKLFLTLLPVITLTLFSAPTAFASANNFSFKSFEGDYYLRTDEEKHASLDIKESLIASFTVQNQNHGIERCIPHYYRTGGGIDLDSITVKQNDSPANFSKIATSDGFVCLRIGDANKYVYGDVKYDIAYTYTDVIMQYADVDYQELYWDTNGTSWDQPFGALTSRLHLPNAVAERMTTDPISCYVGSYGESEDGRCATSIEKTSTETLITFQTKNLAPGENLTMNATFEHGTFAAAVQKKSYLYIIIAVVLTAIFAVIIFLLMKRRSKQSDKIKLAKDKTVPVQYIPLRGFTVAEMGTNYLKSVQGSLNVASLIELATSHKIELERGEKKTFGGYKWKVHVKDLTDVADEQEIVLKILNGGSSVSAGDVIEVKKHTATATLQLLAKSYTEKIEDSLEKKGLREKSTSSKSSTVVIAIVIFILIFGFAFPSLILEFFSSSFFTSVLSHPNTLYVGQAPAIIYSVVATIVFFISIIAIAASTYKYKQRTLEGIKASKYLDGLKEYMQLAEADRLKFLQSVKGADTTSNGIVKLYERLLPYAVLFGIEDSWMNELNKYYQMADVSDPTWINHGVILSSRDFRVFNSYVSSTISSSTMTSSSGSSSGFSGGGGGGFSGGGGGGGGGGGW